ncbi:hypothetical protein OGM63_07220 [Plectonema radiosum NIES-515]|uniref:Uncharacterized protein n=1 Tax=Plectonema radiosum NIES-515 TaxID=2986073 RepID=A0ABT3AX63_9CYAN|nr:hypothetical protein [Plectonema radiosum]MCV3213315.1 hypothetical protein [Plectonema radiosum NIES-515]
MPTSTEQPTNDCLPYGCDRHNQKTVTDGNLKPDNDKRVKTHDCSCVR